MKRFLPYFLCILAGILIALGIFKLRFANISLIEIFSQSPLPVSTFSPQNPPPDSLIGNVSSVSGTVLFQSRMATAPAEVLIPSQIQQGERLVTGEDGKMEISFVDTGKITILSGSDVELVQTLPSNLVFRQEKGTVDYQSTGETSFDIRSLKLITVLPEGNIRISIDAEKNMITSDLRDGEATASYNDSKFVSHIVPLEKNKKFIFDISKREELVKKSL